MNAAKTILCFAASHAHRIITTENRLSVGRLSGYMVAYRIANDSTAAGL